MPSTRPDDDFDRFCRDHWAPLGNALGWTLGDHELGAEAAAEALTRAYERWDRVGPMANPAGWVYTTGLRWAGRRRWRRGREAGLLRNVKVARPTEVEQPPVSDPDLVRALLALPMEMRTVVVLRHMLDQSERDVAATLGIAPGTVKSRLSRGLELLRGELGEQTEAGHHPGPGSEPGAGPVDDRPSAGREVER